MNESDAPGITPHPAEGPTTKAELRRYAARLEAMHAIDRAVLAHEPLATIAEHAVAHLQEIVNCDRASVTFFEFESGQARVMAVAERSGPRGGFGPGSGTTISLDRYPLEDVRTALETRYQPDLAAIPAPSGLQRELNRAGLRSVVSAPIRRGDRAVGEINLGSTRPDHFDAQDQAAAAEMARQLAIAFSEDRFRGLERRSQQQERLASVGRLVAGITHDFSNLLQAIVGYAEMVQDETSLSDTGRDAVTAILELSQKAGQINRQLLDFARQSADEKTVVDLCALTREIARLLEHTLPASITLEVETPAAPAWVVASGTRLQQVIMNLAMNARDAMPDGGRVRIRVSRYELAVGASAPNPGMGAGEWIRLEVEDDGEGIPPQVLPHIFEPFYTTKPRSEGTGLGLAQVQGIVADEGGYIDVSTEEGVGTTFATYFPPAQAPVEAEEQSPSVIPVGDGVLVVEDDPQILAFITSTLERAGFDVVSATSPTAAMEAFRSGDDVAVVIVDLVLPEFPGRDLIEQLRRLRPDLEVIVMSGHGFDAEIARRIRSGDLRCLQKPVGRQELVDAVQAAMAHEAADPAPHQ